MSDNGPSFVSEEFAEVLQQNGICHLRSSQHWSQTKGEAERFVATFKKAVKCCKTGSRNKLELRLNQFLLYYKPDASRYVVGISTNDSSQLSASRSTKARTVHRRPSACESECRPHTRVCRGRQGVCLFWYGTKRWRAGVVFRCSNDGTYEVHVGDQLHRRHVSQLLRDVGHLSETLENEASREEDTPIEEPPATNIAPVCI